MLLLQPLKEFTGVVFVFSSPYTPIVSGCRHARNRKGGQACAFAALINLHLYSSQIVHEPLQQAGPHAQWLGPWQEPLSWKALPFWEFRH